MIYDRHEMTWQRTICSVKSEILPKTSVDKLVGSLVAENPCIPEDRASDALQNLRCHHSAKLGRDLLSQDKVEAINRQLLDNFFQRIFFLFLYGSIELSAGYQNIYRLLIFDHKMTEKTSSKWSDACSFANYCQIATVFLLALAQTSSLRLHRNLLWSYTKMIRSPSSINPESFSRFGEGHVYGGTFPMDSPNIQASAKQERFDKCCWDLLNH